MSLCEPFILSAGLALKNVELLVKFTIYICILGMNMECLGPKIMNGISSVFLLPFYGYASLYSLFLWP